MSVCFGTDGWRGVIAEDFTFANVRRVAQATADYWNSTELPKAAIVGFDNRFLSDAFARLTCEVLAANGIRVLLPPVAVPTPSVSYAIRARQLCGGVMITASHNPPHFNGFKVKADFAGPADVEMCEQIEARLGRHPPAQRGAGDVESWDPRPMHLAAIRKMVDVKAIREAKLRVVFDSMHGCGDRILEKLVGGETIRVERDPYFGGINPEPIAKNLGALCKAVQRNRAAVGVATDGDADRLGVVDERGRYVSIQLVFAMLLLHLIRHRHEKGGLVVKSSNSTVLVDRICQAHGVKWVEVPVGFKHICEQMRVHDVLIGGEESGGMGFRGHIPERDGILANLMLLESLAITGKSVSETAADIQREFGRSAYERIDMPYPLAKRDQFLEILRSSPPAKVLGVPVAEVQTFDGVKYVFRDESWLMFRTSGTEPIVRIYSEAKNTVRVRQLLEYGRRLSLRV